jgi:hypothetical protein
MASNKDYGSMIGGAVSGTASMVQSALANTATKDTTGIKDQINAQKTLNPSVSTNDDLMQSWQSYNPLSHVTARQVRLGDSQRIGNTINSTASGASAGASVGGGWGALIGAAVGLTAGIGGIIGGNAKARRTARKLNKQIDAANSIAQGTLTAKTNTVDTMNDLNKLANSAAFGGPLGGDAISFELASSFLNNGYMNAANKGKSLVSSNSYAKGGKMETNFSNGVIQVNEGSTHEMNPNQGVQMGIDFKGNPNLVEEGEVIYNDYVFSNRITAPESLQEKYKAKKGSTFAEVAKKVQKESEERPNDPISKNYLDASYGELAQAQEQIRQIEAEKNRARRAKEFQKVAKKHPELIQELQEQMMQQQGEQMPEEQQGEPQMFADGGPKKYSTALRYAPIVGNAANVITDAFGITNTPDYTNADLIMNAAYSIPSATYAPLGDYMSYSPMDTNWSTNKLASQASATRRSLRDSFSPNRNAALLAADYNANTQLGDLMRSAQEYNQNQRAKQLEFNRGVNQFNATQSANAQQANIQRGQSILTAAQNAANMRNSIDAAASAGRSANMNSLLTNLGNVGSENLAYNMVNSNKALGFKADLNGWSNWWGAPTKSNGDINFTQMFRDSLHKSLRTSKTE